jgi:hypothetical protein
LEAISARRRVLIAIAPRDALLPEKRVGLSSFAEFR